jgi:TPR repeat protein
MHEHGIGVSRSAGEAALWYQRAAEAGNVAAMTNLADDDPGVERRRDVAQWWAEKAAAAANPHGLSELAGSPRPKWTSGSDAFAATLGPLTPKLQNDLDRLRADAKMYEAEFPRVAAWLRKAAAERRGSQRSLVTGL